jgi:hypothetical protein
MKMKFDRQKLSKRSKKKKKGHTFVEINDNESKSKTVHKMGRR